MQRESAIGMLSVLLPTDREEDLFFSMARLNNSTMVHVNNFSLNDDIFPVGMHGTRHDLFSVSRFSNFLIEYTHLSTADSWRPCQDEDQTILIDEQVQQESS